MNEEDAPTELTTADIDNFVKNIEEKTIAIVSCPSCDAKLPAISTDYTTGQCDECFYARKPWCQAAPVHDAYFKVMDVQ